MNRAKHAKTITALFVVFSIVLGYIYALPLTRLYYYNEEASLIRTFLVSCNNGNISEVRRLSEDGRFVDRHNFKEELPKLLNKIDISSMKISNVSYGDDNDTFVIVYFDKDRDYNMIFTITKTNEGLKVRTFQFSVFFFDDYWV